MDDGFDPVAEPEMAMAPPGESPDETFELMAKAGKAAVYGLLLNADASHPVAAMVRDHWSELHHLTGETFMLVAFQPPAQWTDGLKDYWRRALGDAFEETWAAWQKQPEPGAAFDYLDLFQQPLKASDLPCLVLFTDLKEKKAVLRPIPDWDANSLYGLFKDISDTVRECAARPTPEERLQALAEALGSPGARMAAAAGHFTKSAWDYLRRNPAKVVLTTVGFALALSNASVLPLSAGAIATLKAIKETFGKA